MSSHEALEQNAGGQSDSWLVALWSPRRADRKAMLEVALLMLVVLLFAAGSRPVDPLRLHAGFPWLWLAPCLMALRYGVVAALEAVAMLFLAWLYLSYTGRTGDQFPGEYFLGGASLTLLAGEFADLWTGRWRRVREVNRYLSERLKALTRSHYLLKYSHLRLEQEMLVQPVTLRDSFLHLRRLIVDGGRKDIGLPALQELMRILAQACQIEVAGVHVVVDGRVMPRPLATLGSVATFNTRDPLVVSALARGELCHVQTEPDAIASGRYLVAAPMQDAAGNCIGLLVVERMPFLSLSLESLQFLIVVLGYYADCVALVPAVSEVVRQVPDCPIAFAAELLRLQRVQRACGIESALVALIFEPGPEQKSRVDEAERHLSRMAVDWSVAAADRHLVFSLLPLFGSAGVSEYLETILGRLGERPEAVLLNQGPVRWRVVAVSARPAAALLSHFLEQCHAA